MIEYQYELGMAIESIGDFLVYRELVKDNPVTNCGASFRNEVFELNAYCWCSDSEDGKGLHKEGCPPNFVYGDLKVTWYKHINRGTSQNKTLTLDEIEDMRRKCIDSVSPSATPTLCESINNKKWFGDSVCIKLEYVNGFMSLCQNVGGVPQLGVLLDDREDAEELINALRIWLQTNPRSRND